MIIFIDETGDLGFDFTKHGTSSHFVVTALLVSEDRLRRPLEAAVRRTIKNKLNVGKQAKKKPVNELKGRRTALSIKQYFWRHAQSVPFTLYATVLDKEQVAPQLQRQKNRLYNYVARAAVDAIPVEQCQSVLHVEIDRRQGRRQQEEFNLYLQHHLQARVPTTVPVFIRHLPSERSKGIQAADLFSWGIARRYYRPPDTTWYDVFRDRIAVEIMVTTPAP